MKRTLSISLLLLSAIGAANRVAAQDATRTEMAQTEAALSELPSSSHVEYDSLFLDELLLLPPLPSPLSREQLLAPFPAAFPTPGYGLNRIDHPALAISRPMLPEFIMPDAALLVSYSRFRQQEGITIPAASVNSSRMIMDSRNYMPLVVSGDHALGLTGSRMGYPSMGFSNSISVGYRWSPVERITLYGSVYASDNLYHRNRFKDFGVSGRMRIQVADRLFLNAYGTYSLYSNTGPGHLPPLMYPTTSFGGTIEVKVSDKFGIEGGAQRGFNMFTRQWETSYYVLPVFY